MGHLEAIATQYGALELGLHMTANSSDKSVTTSTKKQARDLLVGAIPSLTSPSFSQPLARWRRSGGQLERLCPLCAVEQAALTAEGFHANVCALLDILRPVKEAINIVQSDTALLSDLACCLLTVRDSLNATTELPSFLTSDVLEEIAERRTMASDVTSPVFLPVHVSSAGMC